MKNVGLKISDEEYEKLSFLAENCGMSRPLFLRNKLQEILGESASPTEGMKILGELRRIANEIKALEENSDGREDPSRLLYHEHYCQLLKEISEIKALFQHSALREEK